MKHYYNFAAKELLGKTPLKKGDVILSCQPFVYVINAHKRGQYCDNCLASAKDKTLKPCRDCGFVFYCSSTCSIEGSSVHQAECKPIKRVEPYVPPNFARLLARLIYKLKNGGEKIFETYTPKRGRKFKDLMNHYRDIKDDPKRMADVHSMMKILTSYIGADMVPNESDFIGIYGRALVNRFCLMDEFMTHVGSAVYLIGSIFDHSCIPNAYPSFQGKRLVVRSLVDWPELDYSKVFISYIDCVNTTAQRRGELKQNWYFRCECSLCSNKERVLFENCLKCENPMCGAPVQVPEKPLSQFSHAPVVAPECGVCGCVVDEEALEEYQSAVAFTRHRLKGIKEDNPCMETCQAILEKQGQIFSNMNVWRVRALDYTFNAAYSKGAFLTALEYGRTNLEGMRYYYGSGHPSLGLFLMKLGKVLLYMKEYREGLTYVEEAENILTVAVGPQHYMITEEISRLKIMACEDIEILIERRLQKEKEEEHELICKHCGRRKGTRVVREYRKNKTNNVWENDVVEEHTEIDPRYDSKYYTYMYTKQ